VQRRARPGVRLTIAAVAALVLLAAMALDTKVVKIGSASDVQPGTFSAPEFGKSEFPKVQSAVEKRAVDAATLAAAIAKDRVAAGKEFGVDANAGPEMPVKFTGVAGKQDFGVYDIKVDGVPSSLVIRLQTGPAVMGTDLRDATGTVNFGQFTNQIEYQNAGSALNKELKKQVLSKVDTGNLTGKTVSVVGVFQLTNPDNWLVTPVRLEVR
jgi:predicted lipoprotein